jgi:hypothetical protein
LIRDLEKECLLPHEERPKVDAAGDWVIFLPFLVCFARHADEVQVRCRFDGSRTNDRFHHVSNSLFPGGNQGALRDERFAGRM